MDGVTSQDGIPEPQATEEGALNPLTSFTLFPKLPIELRREIWRHAFENLPRRPNCMDVLVDFSQRKALGIVESETYQGPHNLPCFEYRVNEAKPPRLSWVCREAREVVLREARTEHYPNSPTGKTFSFQPKLDILHLSLVYSATKPVDCPRMTDGRFKFFAGIADKHKVPLCIMQPAFHCMETAEEGRQFIIPGLDESDSYISQATTIARYSGKLLLPIFEINLHLKKSDAIESGLFDGNQVQLVGLDDSNRLDAFLNLWSTLADKRDPAPEILFDFIRSEQFSEALDYYLLDLKAWLFELVVRKDYPLLRLEYGDATGEVFSPTLTKEIESVSNLCANEKHPWSRRVLDAMPTFIPQLLFRYCSQKCPESEANIGKIGGRALTAIYHLTAHISNLKMREKGRVIHEAL